MSNHSLWQEVDHLTTEILEDAKSEEWLSCTERVEQRKELLQQLFATPVPEAESEQTRVRIEDLLGRDREITQLCQQEFTRLQGELKQFDKERVAAKAYRTSP
ncbi:MAG: flagellar protein FliT [Gammaproteobacteria bacterium]|nr:flagellar protein FliT [Gammaproteobacteria bacterium]